MNISWLNRQGHPDCVLFMAGWGMEPAPFLPIPTGNLDVCMVWDYCNLATDPLYKALSDNANRSIHLLAWSMGVWVAATLLHELPFASTTALAGTCTPVDDRLGIPVNVFDNMIESFSAGTLDNFYTSMFSDTAECKQFLQTPPDRSQSELLEELVFLRSTAPGNPASDIFDTHVVTGRDQVFPPRNQLRAWGKQNCTTRSLPHFPFYTQPSWEELLCFLRDD
jgi:biotin synthesis protein BioG